KMLQCRRKCWSSLGITLILKAMYATKDWLKASWHARKDMLRPVAPCATAPLGTPEHDAPVVVPIRALGPSYRERITQHLLQLDPADRYLRFGYAANDEQIRRYADQLDFERDEIFGIYNRRLELIAMAHLAFSEHPEHKQCAEFGV